MFFFSWLFLCGITFVTSLSSQEDLSISKYSQIGCLILKSDKQVLVHNTQENYLLPYQTFSSSDMTIELCFRLCRRWIILMYENQKKCICLHTIQRLYQLDEYLGEVSSINNCTSNDLLIYSLTEDSYVLPSLLFSSSYDWSLDGCYSLNGIQTISVNLLLDDVDYIQAIDLCRKHCQINRGGNSYSYFLSRKKSCYCLPIKFTQTAKTIALRRPLIHCSFLPYICRAFSNSCKKDYSEINGDTLIKIDVQQYCSSTNFLSFTFDRMFSLCFKSILIDIQTSFSTIIYNQKCLPLLIKTYEQWNYFIRSSWITYSKIFIWIDRNSTYIFNDLLKFDNRTLLENELCMVMVRIDSNKISYELIQCSAARLPGYVLCTQQPFQSTIPYEEEFRIISNESEHFNNEFLSCPPGFVLFNKICYYIHSSFVYDIRSAERICYGQYSNSTVVKFDSHKWENINTTIFRGRKYDDILLEFFYYLLEKKLFTESINGIYGKRWLRLLIGSKYNPRECVLRYFTRSLGGFTVFYRCNNGGHPVCQCEPVRTKIPTITSTIQTSSNQNNSIIETKKTELITSTEALAFNSTTMLVLFNTSMIYICENCSKMSLSVADEDLLNNETNIEFNVDNSTLIETTNGEFKKKYLKYRSLIIILTGPILGLIILCVGSALLIWYARKKYDSHSNRSSMVGGHRTKRSSTTLTTGDLPNTPAVLYTRLKPPQFLTAESDMLFPLDHSLPDDDNIELLSATRVQMSVPGKKGRDSSQLPTLSYEIKLNLPTNVDSNPQEISFLDLIANDAKFKNDKESLEFVLSSYVKACGKQSVTEILAEQDTMVEGNASLSDMIHALMDFNDQQNANLGVGYNDPEDDDSFIDDSTAAQDIIPKNMTNERDGFYVNEKHQPIQARYLSEPSDSDSDGEDEGESEDDDDDDNDESSESEKEDKQNKKNNNNQEDSNEKNVKKSRTDEDITPKIPNTKRKRSISEVGTSAGPNNLDEKNKPIKPVEDSVKKVKKLSETTSDSSSQNLISYVLPTEMDNDIKPSVEKIVKLIISEQVIDTAQKKIERLFYPNICRELLELVKKLHRHTNAHRQLVFDILSSRTGVSASILITRARLLLLNDYEPSLTSISLNDLKEKLRVEINRSLEFHIQAHNQAIKEWQQKMAENPSKDKNRGPRKNFRLYKTINELIIRCIDRKLETMTIFDSDSLELFLHDHIVTLWEKPGWMTAKKIINEVIRIEYRPLRDPNQSSQVTRVTPVPSTAERVKKDSQPVLLPPPQPPPSQPSKVSNSNSSPTKIPQQQNLKTHDTKSPSHASTTSNHAKSLEMATRVITNPNKQHASRPESNTSQSSEHSSSKSDVVRPVAKPSVTSTSESSTKRHSTPNVPSLVDLTMDLFSQYKKQSTESVNSIPKSHTHSPSTKDLSLSQRATPSPTTAANNSKLQQQQQQQQQAQQFATKLPSEKTLAGSFLKDALLTGSSSPKISTSPLAVDNMINKSHHSSKSNVHTSTTPQNTNTHRSSTSSKSNTNRPKTDLTPHRTDQQIQQHKSSSSSSSNRSQSNTAPSSSISPAPRRSTTGFPSSHEQQTNRGLSSQIPLSSALSQSMQWDSATLQLAAAALANPALLNSAVFDPSVFNSVFGSAANIAPSNQSSSSRQQHSQNTNNNRRI